MGMFLRSFSVGIVATVHVLRGKAGHVCATVDACDVKTTSSLGKTGQQRDESQKLSKYKIDLTAIVSEIISFS